MQHNLNDVVFLPLDLENLNFPNFSENFAANSTILPELTKMAYSNGIEGKTTSNINYWHQWLAFSLGKWDDAFTSVYPETVSVFKSMPYEKLLRVYFFKQVRTVDPHTDITTGLQTPYPSAVRYWCINDELKSTFYFQNRPDGDRVVRKVPVYPTDTKWWVMNSMTVRHGSHMPKKNEKIILGVYGIPDPVGFNDLLQRSMTKYSNFVIHKQDL